METWAIVTLVLGSSAVSALLTFFITKMQVSHSDKRLEMELERAREADERRRRWEVRSVPLLKLRHELAQMATKQNKVVVAAHEIQDSNGLARKQAEENLQKAQDDWITHTRNGDLLRSLFTQYDTELCQKVLKVSVDYETSYNTIMHVEDIQEASALSEEIWPEVTEVQGLINRKLEEL